MQLPKAEMLYIRFLSCAVAFTLNIACRTQQTQPTYPVGKLYIVVEPPQAFVYIDDKLVGNGKSLSNRPLIIKQGKHRLKVESKGYFPFYTLVNADDIGRKLKIKLRKIPPPLIEQR